MSAHAVSVSAAVPPCSPCSPLPACLPPITHITHAVGLGATRLVFGWRLPCPCWRFSQYVHVLFVVFHSFFFWLFFFSPSNWIQEKSLWELPHTHTRTHIFSYYFMAHGEKNRNLLTVNFRHNPRSLRQTLVSFFAVTAVVVVKMKSCSCGMCGLFFGRMLQNSRP